MVDTKYGWSLKGCIYVGIFSGFRILIGTKEWSFWVFWMQGITIFARYKLRLVELCMQYVWWCVILWGFGDSRIKFVTGVLQLYSCFFDMGACRLNHLWWEDEMDELILIWPNMRLIMSGRGITLSLNNWYGCIIAYLTRQWTCQDMRWFGIFWCYLLRNGCLVHIVNSWVGFNGKFVENYQDIQLYVGCPFVGPFT